MTVLEAKFLYEKFVQLSDDYTKLEFISIVLSAFYGEKVSYSDIQFAVDDLKRRSIVPEDESQWTLGSIPITVDGKVNWNRKILGHLLRIKSRN